MMKLIKTLHNVLSIEKNNYFIFIRTNNVSNDKIAKDEFFISANKYSYVGIPLLIQRRFSPNLEIFNKKTNKFDIKHQNTIFALPNIKRSNEYLTPILNTNTINYYKNFELINSFSFNRTLQQLTIFYSNFIVYTNPYPKTHLTCYTLDNNKEPVWHFKVPEGFIIAPKIQVVENVIVFEAHKDHYNYMNFYGVSIYTGKIVWEINKTPDSKEVLIIWANINPKDNLAYGYSADLYQVFDPVKGKILIEKDMSTYWKKTKGIDPMPDRAYIANNRLWFVGTNNEKPAFGAINIQTHELEFVQELPKETGILVKILYHNNKIYINDYEGHLYVFEDKDTTS